MPLEARQVRAVDIGVHASLIPEVSFLDAEFNHTTGVVSHLHAYAQDKKKPTTQIKQTVVMNILSSIH